MEKLIIHILIILGYLLMVFLSRKESIQREEKESIFLLPFCRIAVFLERLKENTLPPILKAKLAKSNKKITENRQNIELAALNPRVKLEESKRKYRAFKAGYLLLFIFIGNLSALFIVLSQTGDKELENDYYLEREDESGTKREVGLSAIIEEQENKEAIEVEISPREYTFEEVQKLFEETSNCLEIEILGENEALNAVRTDLNFQNEIGNSGIEISFETDHYQIVDANGKVNNENLPEEGCTVEITAVLTYLTYEYQHLFEIQVLPPVLTEEEKVRRQLQEEIEEADQRYRTEKKYKLPDKVGGKSIKWQEKEENTNWLILGIGLIAGILVFFLTDQQLKKEMEERKRQMTMDYSEIVSKLTLLLGAGMTIQGAWKRIVEDYLKKESRKKEQRYAYEEMRTTLHELQSGLPETEAYERFGRRCRVQMYLKFGGLLSQNVKKGSQGLISLLQAEAAEAFEERKHQAKKAGEEAGTKLLVPLFLMLLVVIVIIMIPAFLSFRF